MGLDRRPPREATYDYTVPFTLRWPERFDGTLIYYQHGYPNLGFSLLVDGFIGPDNGARHSDELESFSVLSNVLAPTRGHALFAPNLGGLTRAGDLAAFAEDGPCEGDPLNLSVDAPITRDLAVLAKRLLSKLAGSPAKRTIGIGHSGGALVLQFVTGGVTTFLFDGPNAAQRAYTGDNHVSAYDPSSPIIFDGVIPLAGSAPQLAQPFTATAKVMLIGGNADYAGIEMVRYASRLLRAGVDVNAMVRVYQVTNLSHNFAEIALSTPMTNAVLKDVFGVDVFADGDRLAPVVAAAVDNMKAWIAKGTPPPPSRINGLAVDTDGDGEPDAIAFTQAGGLTTGMVPMADKSPRRYDPGGAVSGLGRSGARRTLPRDPGDSRPCGGWPSAAVGRVPRRRLRVCRRNAARAVRGSRRALGQLQRVSALL